MSTVYVFALTNQSAPPFRHGNRRIEFIEVGGVHAAVERAARRPAVSEDALRAQHEIVTKIAESVDAILPARFGALLDSAELASLVSMRLAPITKTLELVSGRVQMTVRVFTGLPPSPRRRRPAVASAETGHGRPSGTEYLEQRRRDAAAALTGEAASISAAVRGLVTDERTACGQGRDEWTLYHLVDRGVLPRYERAIEPFKSSAVAVTGPWPPFAFVPDLWS
jgi:Gas vesicle synthesis protein GvpL/GvpF